MLETPLSLLSRTLVKSSTKCPISNAFFVQVIEVRMIQGLFRSNPIFGTIRQQLFQEVQSCGIQIVRDSFGIICLVPFRKCCVPILQLSDSWPHLLRWRAKLAENLEDLINFRISREKRAFRDHLNKDGPNSPDINRWGIGLRSKENFWWPVPQRHNLVGQWPNWGTEGPRQPEVGKFETAIPGDEQVLRFQISVHDPSGMAESKTTTALKKVRLHKKRRQHSGTRFHVFLQIPVQEFENEVQLSI